MPATVNVTLEVGTATEVIEVSAQSVAINTTDASLGVAFNYNITRDAKHRLSWSGALANEASPQGQYLPSAPTGSLFNYTNAETTFLDYSKGFVASYSAVLSNSLVNNFRYGFVRESTGNSGDSVQTYIIMRVIT